MAFTKLPRTIEEIFKDFSARRDSILRALTTDEENVCLYGHPTGWDVTFPIDEAPPDFPEPVMGINFARDSMARIDWIAKIAMHSDSWLLSLAFFFGFQLNRNDRKRLFSLINELPTVFEVVTEKKLLKGNTEKSSDSQTKSSVSSNDVYSIADCGSCAGN